MEEGATKEEGGIVKRSEDAGLPLCRGRRRSWLRHGRGGGWWRRGREQTRRDTGKVVATVALAYGHAPQNSKRLSGHIKRLLSASIILNIGLLVYRTPE